MSGYSTLITVVGLAFLVHACYSAHEHFALYSINVDSLTSISSFTATPNSIYYLPIDISIETILAIIIICLGLVLGTPELRPIQWRVWAGQIERQREDGIFKKNGMIDNDYVGNFYKALEIRPGFVDIRMQRKRFIEWAKNGQLPLTETNGIAKIPK
ncbi:unnamed protein product [Blumeria hordei]|uniref:Uncharacterized protein n=2 Tax=Blumeria hordei TaxID=2867405 RepID=A0A383UK45_BLUHO|nr:DNA mismatch repair protein mutS/Putative magnesium transport protein [Blumeria hordei DH14]SZF00206.1 unnamed protein product [Blumeria hordei]